MLIWPLKTVNVTTSNFHLLTYEGNTHDVIVKDVGTKLHRPLKSW